MGYRHGCAFVPAARLEAIELVSQIGSLATGRGVGGLDLGGLLRPAQLLA
jgi:hypothetical protein